MMDKVMLIPFENFFKPGQSHLAVLKYRQRPAQNTDLRLQIRLRKSVDLR